MIKGLSKNFVCIVINQPKRKKRLVIFVFKHYTKNTQPITPSAAQFWFGKLE